MENPFNLEGKTIVITGASSGIGQQCAIDCAGMGAKVILIARNEDKLKATIALMEGNGHQYYVSDISKTNTINDLIKKIVDDNGLINGFIHSAGKEKSLPVKILDYTTYNDLYNINTLSAFEFVHQFSNIRYFAKGGSIIFISSICSLIARPGVAAYSASKGALISASKVMAIEMAKKRIRVNCISPGTILTPMMKNVLDKLPEEDYKKRISGFPLGLGKTKDISNACIYLLSDASSWITGQNFIIDGGYTIL